jgi:hypothetical protein
MESRCRYTRINGARCTMPALDDRQVGTLTHVMQTGLKPLRQMHQLEAELKAEDAVLQVAYDDDGLTLAADPAPAARGKTLRKVTACAAPEPARTAAEQAPGPGAETTADAEPELAATADPSSSDPVCFQTLIHKLGDNRPVIKHLRYSPESGRLFSNTYLPPEGIDLRDLSALPAHLLKVIEGIVLGSGRPQRASHAAETAQSQ